MTTNGTLTTSPKTVLVTSNRTQNAFFINEGPTNVRITVDGSTPSPTAGHLVKPDVLVKFKGAGVVVQACAVSGTPAYSVSADSDDSKIN